MVRDLPIGNGNLLINFDRNYGLRDIYWPYVGQDNHTRGDLSRFGVWVDGAFAWLEGEGWNRTLTYANESLVTDVTCRHTGLGVELHFADCIDFDRDLFLRQIDVRNLTSASREVRCFQHFDAHLWGSSVGDTAYYDPTHRALVHYKGRCYVLVCGRGPGGVGMDSFATGTKETAGREGTWRDAENGRLSRNLVAQGSVDSVAAWHLRLEPGATERLVIWFCFGDSYDAVNLLHETVVARTPELFHDRTHKYWRWWVTAGEPDLSALGERLVALYRRSQLILRTNIDNRGAPIAANDAAYLQFGRDTYSYMWPRDGALIADALVVSGHAELARRFFEFCTQVKQRAGYLLHKYNPDGSPGSSWLPWSTPDGKLMLPIQEDETGLVIWALWEYFRRFQNVDFVRPFVHPLVRNAAEFMMSYRDAATGLPAPSYDLWEERRGVFTFTVAAVQAGLRAAANFMREAGLDQLDRAYRMAADEMCDAACKYLYDPDAGRFARMLTVSDGGTVTRDLTIDASLIGVAQFGMLPVDDPRLMATVAAVEQRLWVKTAVGGMARYERDDYQAVTRDFAAVPGNPWFTCTLWLADWRIMRARDRADLARARALLEWCAAYALPSGVMAEQLNPYTGAPMSVSPLSWSHAAFITTAHRFAQRWRELPDARGTK